MAVCRSADVSLHKSLLSVGQQSWERLSFHHANAGCTLPLCGMLCLVALGATPMAYSGTCKQRVGQ